MCIRFREYRLGAIQIHERAYVRHSEPVFDCLKELDEELDEELLGRTAPKNGLKERSGRTT